MELNDYEPIKNYAERHGVDASTIRHRILNGQFKNDVVKLSPKIMLIKKDAPYTDHRKKTK